MTAETRSRDPKSRAVTSRASNLREAKFPAGTLDGEADGR